MDYSINNGSAHEILTLEEWLDLPKKLVQLYSANNMQNRAARPILPSIRANYNKLENGSVAASLRDRISVFGSISGTENLMIRFDDVTVLRLHGYLAESTMLFTNYPLVHSQTVIRSADNKEFSLVKSNIVNLYGFLSSRGKTLDLSDYRLKEVPQKAFEGKVSKFLANKNRLSDLASGFLSFAKLQRLSLSDNNFTEIPEILFQLTSLKNISFANNKITTLPSKFSQLVALRQLYMEGNQLETVPQELAALPELIILNLSENRITSSAWPQLMKITNIHRLLLNGNDIDSVPDDVTIFASLRVLGLSRNKIRSVPTSIALMASLRRLHLGFNLLETLPQELAKLRKLQILELNDNKISRVPPQFWVSLSKHTKVSLENNNMGNHHSVKPKTPGKPMITKLNIPMDSHAGDMGESAWDRTMKKAAIGESRFSPRNLSPRASSPRHLSPRARALSPTHSSLDSFPARKDKDKEKDKDSKDKKDKKKDKDKDKEKDKEKEKDKDKDKKKAKIKGLREQKGLLKSKSLEISVPEDKGKTKAQALEDEKNKLKEFEKLMNKSSKASKKDAESDSVSSSPKESFIRTTNLSSSGSAALDGPSSPKARAAKRMSVIDLKALRKNENGRSVSTSVADDTKIQTQKPTTIIRKRSTSANTALPVPTFPGLRRTPSGVSISMEPIDEQNRPELTVTSPTGTDRRSNSSGPRLARTDSAVRLRTREEFKELLNQSSTDVKQAVLPTSPKKRRRSVSYAALSLFEKTFLDNLPDSADDYVLDRNNGEKTTLSACSIEKLIEFVTHERGKDKLLTSNFLVALPYFLTGKDLMQRLKKRYEDSFTMTFLPSPKDGAEVPPTEESNSKYSNVLQESLFDLLKQVFNYHPQMIDEEGVREELIEISQLIVKHSKDEATAAPLTLLIKSILEGLRSKYRSTISFQLKDEELEGAPDPLIPANIDIDNLDILDIAPEEIARQMTLLDFEQFTKIEPKEWFAAHKNHHALTPNINSFIKRFNEMSRWVSSMIVLTEAQDLRTLLINNFIIIALKCWELNNFNGVMEVISGLEAAPVQRLASTWSNIPPKTVRKFEQLKDLMSITGNFRKVREMLISTTPPCVPYIGVYLQDLVFIEDGNQTWTDEGLLNFDKISIFAKVLQPIRTFQQTPYRLFPIPFLQDFLMHKLILLDDNTIEEESFKRELRPMGSPKVQKTKDR